MIQCECCHNQVFFDEFSPGVDLVAKNPDREGEEVRIKLTAETTSQLLGQVLEVRNTMIAKAAHDRGVNAFEEILLGELRTKNSCHTVAEYRQLLEIIKDVASKLRLR
jgi:hypothetical protein